MEILKILFTCLVVLGGLVAQVVDEAGKLLGGFVTPATLIIYNNNNFYLGPFTIYVLPTKLIYINKKKPA